MRIRHAALTSTFNNVLDTHGTLTARAHQGLRASLKGIARSVAFVIGISLSIPMQAVDAGRNHSFTSKDYIRSLFNKEQSSCLIRLYGKESAFNTKAIGNLSSPTKSYVYGIPQLKNPLIKDMNAYNQIDYGIKYIKHRYETPCRAYAHWVKKGWH